MLTMAIINKESPRLRRPQGGGHVNVHGRQGRREVGRLESPISRLNRRVRADKIADSLEDSPRQREETRDLKWITEAGQATREGFKRGTISLTVFVFSLRSKAKTVNI